MTMLFGKSGLRVTGMCAFYILYLVIGAAIFSAIEGPKERQKIKALKKVRNNFLAENGCLSGTCLTFCALMSSNLIHQGLYFPEMTPYVLFNPFIETKGEVFFCTIQ